MTWRLSENIQLVLLTSRNKRSTATTTKTTTATATTTTTTTTTTKITNVKSARFQIIVHAQKKTSKVDIFAMK